MLLVCNKWNEIINSNSFYFDLTYSPTCSWLVLHCIFGIHVYTYCEYVEQFAGGGGWGAQRQLL